MEQEDRLRPKLLDVKEPDKFPSKPFFGVVLIINPSFIAGANIWTIWGNESPQISDSNFVSKDKPMHAIKN